MLYKVQIVVELVQYKINDCILGLRQELCKFYYMSYTSSMFAVAAPCSGMAHSTESLVAMFLTSNKSNCSTSTIGESL